VKVKETPETRTIVEVGSARFGNGFVVIAGPCAVESEEQIEEAAAAVAIAGADMLRGGAFKPRTSPYSFQGLGLDGARLLAAAARRQGLPCVTEVVAVADVHPLAELVDMLQIGARNMQNFELLKAVGRAGRPVLLKRGLSATVEEWLSAAEYLLDAGQPNVVLCERGIRTFEPSTRNTLDLAVVPLLRRLTHLPVIVDPSHATGRRDLVLPLADAAAAVGAAGIMVDAHPNPEQARCDGAQSLHLSEVQKLTRRTKFFASHARE